MASNKPIVAHHRTGAYSLIVPNALKLRRSHSLQLFKTAGVFTLLRRSLSPDTDTSKPYICIMGIYGVKYVRVLSGLTITTSRGVLSS
jgi:hypothetical protein